MKNRLSNIISDIHGQRRSEKLYPEDIYFALTRSRCGEILFVFIRGIKEPSYIFKISRYDNFKQLLKNEYDVLTKLNKLDFGYQASFPIPCWNGDIKGHHVLLETACTGRSLNEYICSAQDLGNKQDTIFSFVSGFLVDLYIKTKTENNQSSYVNGVLEGVDLYKKGQDLSYQEEENIKAFCTGIDVESCPVLLQHGDFSSWNIIYDKNIDKFSVLDWGYAAFKGFPLIDLLSFFLAWQAVISGYNKIKKSKTIHKSFMKNINRPLAGPSDFIEVFYEDNKNSRLVRKYINIYCTAVRIDIKHRELLFLIFILRHLYSSKNFLSIWLEKGAPLVLRELK
ncbi:MAG: aminoglycoside phosphotransferase family protein [Candidatus Omnitrophica bacterium]|nr:aminoglycoside phosphotransferase family protein [Candidatus Omnitrophota bacterium]